MRAIFTKKNCIRSMLDTSVETNKGLIAILKPELLNDDYKVGDYKDGDYQLVRLTGGFGCMPTALGNTCYIYFCKDGTKTKFERYQFLGIADEEATKYAEELESQLMPLKPEERQVLEQAVLRLLPTYRLLYESYPKNFRETYFIFENLKRKLQKESEKYLFDEIELMRLVSCLKICSSSLKSVIRTSGKNPEENEECLFLDVLYAKIQNEYLSFNAEQSL